MESHRDNQLIRCPNGHILGTYDTHGMLRVKHKGRLVTCASPNAQVSITCEHCGRSSRLLLDVQAIHAQ